MVSPTESAAFPPLEGLLLDWDGTTADSPRVGMNFHRQLCADHGKPFPLKDFEHWRREQREPFWTFYQHVLGFNWERDEKAITDAFEAYMKSCDIPLKEGMHSLITLASAHRLSLGIASSNTADVIKHTLGKHGLGDYFPAIVGYEFGLSGKPHPDQLLCCAEILGIPPAACAYVGDAVWDIQAARAAGMRAVAVDGGIGLPETLKAAKPDHFAPTTESLWEYIAKEMNGGF